jgi:hypothetical protein
VERLVERISSLRPGLPDDPARHGRARQRGAAREGAAPEPLAQDETVGRVLALLAYDGYDAPSGLPTACASG